MVQKPPSRLDQDVPVERSVFDGCPAVPPLSHSRSRHWLTHPQAEPNPPLLDSAFSYTSRDYLSSTLAAQESPDANAVFFSGMWDPVAEVLGNGSAPHATVSQFSDLDHTAGTAETSDFNWGAIMGQCQVQEQAHGQDQRQEVKTTTARADGSGAGSSRATGGGQSASPHSMLVSEHHR